MKHTNFFSALKTAIAGLRSLFMESRNARIQMILFILVLMAGAYVRLNAHDWRWILFASGLVFMMEAINTSIEHLADLISLEFHPKIKSLKDISAAAVLIACLFSLIIGTMIFWPYLSAILPS